MQKPDFPYNTYTSEYEWPQANNLGAPQNLLPQVPDQHNRLPPSSPPYRDQPPGGGTHLGQNGKTVAVAKIES